MNLPTPVQLKKVLKLLPFTHKLQFFLLLIFFPGNILSDDIKISLLIDLVTIGNLICCPEVQSQLIAIVIICFLRLDFVIKMHYLPSIS